MSCTRPGRSHDEGSVTIEAAISLSVLVLVLAMCLSGIGCAIAQIRCVDAAREAVRLAARGEQGRAVEAVTRLAPAGASVNLQINDTTVTATVVARGVGGLIPGVQVNATAMAAAEPVMSGQAGAQP